MRAKNNPCPETGAQCYVPDCTDVRCDFQGPDERQYNLPSKEMWKLRKTDEDSYTLTSLPEKAPPPDPVLETRVENTEKAITDLYWRLKQLKEKWEGKKDE